MKLPFTIVTAAINESKTLPKFIKHVTKIAQEIIIVVDYRTTDDTAEIAEKFGCKVINDLGESGGIVFYNKNRGAKAASFPWVFIMDADERMDDTLQEEISKIVTNDPINSADLYQTSFINYEFGKFFSKCEQKNKPFIRLFKKGKFSYKTAHTTEGFGIQTNSLGKLGKFGKILLKIPVIRSIYLNRSENIITLKGKLIHYSHPTIPDFIRKIDFYSSREARLKFKVNPRPSYSSIILFMFLAPAKEFTYKFFIWKFYREGIHGLIASVIYAFYHFLMFAKYYSISYRDKNRAEISKQVRKYNFPHNSRV